MRGDLRFATEPPRVLLKLDRLGGDLWGLKRAVDQLGAGVGDEIMVRYSGADGDLLERFTVVSLDTGTEGQLEIAPGDMNGARILWTGITRVRASAVMGKRAA